MNIYEREYGYINKEILNPLIGLGNTYYHIDDTKRAIIHYERVLSIVDSLKNITEIT